MDAQKRLLEKIHKSDSALLGPRPLAHSQELAEGLPRARHHVGPGIWYQTLEAGSAPVPRRTHE